MDEKLSKSDSDDDHSENKDRDIPLSRNTPKTSDNQNPKS